MEKSDDRRQASEQLDSTRICYSQNLREMTLFQAMLQMILYNSIHSKNVVLVWNITCGMNANKYSIWNA